MVSPQRRRERKEEILVFAGERPANTKVRYPPGNYLDEGQSPASAGFNPASHGIEHSNGSLCVLCGFAVKKDFLP